MGQSTEMIDVLHDVHSRIGYFEGYFELRSQVYIAISVLSRLNSNVGIIECREKNQKIVWV